MSIPPEMLDAYADGELDALAARRVEQAVAEDPALRSRLDELLELRTRLQAHFAAEAGAPVPESWTAMIEAAAAGESNVVSLAEARRTRRVPAWGAGMAIAASLVLGLTLGTQIVQNGPVVTGNGRMAAAAELAAALDTQLAAESGNAPIRMIASFRREEGDYCRVFSSADFAGLACHESDEWTIERLVPGTGPGSGQYRQAGSPLADLLSEAQDMAAGEALDAEEEARARANKWR